LIFYLEEPHFRLKLPGRGRLPESTLIETILPGALAVAPPSFTFKLGTSVLVEGTYSPHIHIPWHRHSVTHCTYVLDGGYWETCAGSKLHLESGDLRFHPKGEVHCDVIGREGARCLNIEFFSSDALAPALEALHRRVQDFSNTLQCAARSELTSHLAVEFCGVAQRSPERIQTATRLQRIVDEFLWKIVRRHLPPWLNKCIEEITKRAPVAPSLNELAKLAQLHPTHVVRSFGWHLGQTPGEYVRARRVSRACDFLATDKWALVDVALASGFYDQAHFGRVFRASLGTTPAKFRNECKGRIGGKC
jgi:AraC family transcriptional regulator